MRLTYFTGSGGEKQNALSLYVAGDRLPCGMSAVTSFLTNIAPLHNITQTEPDGPQSTYLASPPSAAGTHTQKPPSGHVSSTFLR